MVNPPADFESEIESRKFKIGLTTNKVIRTKKEKGKSRDGENLSVSFLIVSLRVFLFLVTSIFLIGGDLFSTNSITRIFVENNIIINLKAAVQKNWS